LFADALSVAVTIITIVAVFILKDSTPLAYLIPSVFGLSATSHGFYYWKAKAENIKKYGYREDEEL